MLINNLLLIKGNCGSGQIGVLWCLLKKTYFIYGGVSVILFIIYYYFIIKLFNCFYINRMENGTLLGLVVKENKALTYVKAKTLVKELASCVQVSY